MIEPDQPIQEEEAVAAPAPEAEEEEEEDWHLEELFADPPEPPFMNVQILNPEPRPTNNFTVWNRTEAAVCGIAAEFPAVCTILLKEGEPTDYIVNRGYCCVLGVVRTENPRIVPNACVIKNNYIRQLSLQFLSESLTTFVLPVTAPDGTPNRPIWLKLAVKCRPHLL